MRGTTIKICGKNAYRTEEMEAKRLRCFKCFGERNTLFSLDEQSCQETGGKYLMNTGGT